MHVQTVDLHQENAPQRFVASLQHTGFAILKNHPIPAELIENVYQEWRTYFASDTKFQDRFDPKRQAGYFPLGSENAKDAPEKDLKEFYHYYPQQGITPLCARYTPKLYEALEDLAKNLLVHIEKALPRELQSELSMPLSQMPEGSAHTLLRPLHYPPLTGQESAGAVRAAAHEDINLITLLVAGTAPGLQVKTAQGEWLDISCDPGQIAVNSGDMLSEATAGYFPSTTHRVVNPQGDLAHQSRYSIPLFLHPHAEVRLSEKHTAASYLHERLKQLGLL